MMKQKLFQIKKLLFTNLQQLLFSLLEFKNTFVLTIHALAGWIKLLQMCCTSVSQASQQRPPKSNNQPSKCLICDKWPRSNSPNLQIEFIKIYQHLMKWPKMQWMRCSYGLILVCQKCRRSKTKKSKGGGQLMPLS